jgi:hypothetical protein
MMETQESELWQYRLKGASEWTTHSVYEAGRGDVFRKQVVPVLRRRFPGGVETRVISVEAESAEFIARAEAAVC